jgi:hypothetical protein
VRLASQSSDYFPLTAVDGSRFSVAQNHYGLLSERRITSNIFPEKFSHFLGKNVVSAFTKFSSKKVVRDSIRP